MFESFIGIIIWTALFTLLNFLLLFFVAKKFLFVPVKKMISDRQQEIDDQYARAEAAETQARELQCAYEQKLEQAVQTGEKLVQEAVARTGMTASALYTLKHRCLKKLRVIISELKVAPETRPEKDLSVE